MCVNLLGVLCQPPPPPHTCRFFHNRLTRRTGLRNRKAQHHQGECRPADHEGVRSQATRICPKIERGSFRVRYFGSRRCHIKRAAGKVKGKMSSVSMAVPMNNVECFRGMSTKLLGLTGLDLRSSRDSPEEDAR